MPYIKQDDRSKFEHWLKGAALSPPKTPGELNYLITRLILTYLPPEPTYQDFNDIIGAIEGAKMEFYRRYVVKYEDHKIEQNGDVK
jgi:hypothetical protein